MKKLAIIIGIIFLVAGVAAEPWTLMTGPSARTWHSSVAMPDGSTVVMGGLGVVYGSQSNNRDFKNDVWLATDNGAPVPDALNEKVRVQMSALPLTFIPNQGQYDPTVTFVVTGPQSTLFFTQDEIVITTEEKNGNGSVSHVVRQTFPGASTDPMITGTDQLDGTANFFIGNDPLQLQTGVPTYSTVEYHDLYTGIDLRYKGTEGTLKREFVVAPGAAPSVIRLGYDGVDSIAVDETGALVLTTGTSTLSESPLICYQEINGKIIPVNAAYQILDDHEVAFTLGQYNPAFPLVIDPPLVYSTFLGGTSDDWGYDIAVDESGNAYVIGYTLSSDLPTTAGAYNRIFGGWEDVFVTKLNADGTGLVYSTYLFGIYADYSPHIAVDADGNAYVIGDTVSTNIPTTAGAYDSTLNGDVDAFVTKLNAAGSDLVYSTYLGGTGGDYAGGIAVDGSGNAYVTGKTKSTGFPTTAGAYNRTFGGGYDTFVTKLNAAGSDLVYSTYLGGIGWDFGQGIVVDGSGNAYVIGDTLSADFPTTAEAYSRTFGGNYDAFVMKLNADGTGLVYSTYLGGQYDDHGRGIAVDGNENAYVTGFTASPSFPTTAGAYDLTFGGGYDTFVTKLNADGTGLVYSTYLGGLGTEHGLGIAVDGSGNAYVTGDTLSADFPTTAGAYDLTFGGGYDTFVTKLPEAGTGLVYSTYLGGLGNEYGRGIAVDGSGNAYVTGYTNSTGFPTTAGAFDEIYGGNYDAFIAKFSLSDTCMDTDADTICDPDDNCPAVVNPTQTDTDGDGIGDACDTLTDSDDDGIADAVDNCPAVSNADQLNTDGDTLGDACDTDDDNDGVLDTVDNAPLIANPDQLDTDHDGIGDVADPDDDNDGVPDVTDNCPLVGDLGLGLDATGCPVGDTDGDGVADPTDNCPAVSNADQLNTDGDTLGDACDTDDDNDGVLDTVDNAPLIANPDQLDTDHDGIGDVADPDDDNDGVPDVTDNCPLVGDLGLGLDATGCPVGDTDGDGVADPTDNCPVVANPTQTDADNDGIGDACDTLTDSDDDGIADAVDNCPAVANPTQTDSDNDGIGDACEACTDIDSDGVCDATDNCPQIANPNQLDTDGDGTGDVCEPIPNIPEFPSLFLPVTMIFVFIGVVLLIQRTREH